MTTPEESAAAFAAGNAFFKWYPGVPFDEWDNPRDRRYFRVLDRSLKTAPDDFRAGWLWAQHEAEQVKQEIG